MTTSTAQTLWPDETVKAALNRAADDVLAHASSDEQLTAAVNLVVNATMHYLTEPEADLLAVVRAMYDPDVADDVLDTVAGRF